MARPRTPTNVLDARGAFKKDPQRKRQDAETAGELTDPPLHLTGAELDAWHEIVRCAPRDVITDSDRLSLEMMASLLTEFRLLKSEFTAAKLVRLEALLGKFGMTPADRAKVGGKPEKPKGNPFADL